jgi:hypothetical protein
MKLPGEISLQVLIICHENFRKSETLSTNINRIITIRQLTASE